MRCQFPIPPRGVSKPDQPIFADSAHYGKVVLSPVSKMHDHWNAQGRQVVELERGPSSPEAVLFDRLREIGKGRARERRERAALEAP